MRFRLLAFLTLPNIVSVIRLEDTVSFIRIPNASTLNSTTLRERKKHGCTPESGSDMEEYISSEDAPVASHLPYPILVR